MRSRRAMTGKSGPGANDHSRSGRSSTRSASSAPPPRPIIKPTMKINWHMWISPSTPSAAGSGTVPSLVRGQSPPTSRHEGLNGDSWGQLYETPGQTCPHNRGQVGTGGLSTAPLQPTTGDRSCRYSPSLSTGLKTICGLRCLASLRYLIAADRTWLRPGCRPAASSASATFARPQVTSIPSRSIS